MRPRLLFLSNTVIGERISALVCLLCALSIAIPLPLTNFIPAAGIAVIALGILSTDGAIILLGFLVAAIGLFISTLVVFLGPKVVIEMFRFFFKS